jgi:hypothetical protein
MDQKSIGEDDFIVNVRMPQKIKIMHSVSFEKE